jgi:predicted nucleotidyltransferase
LSIGWPSSIAARNAESRYRLSARGCVTLPAVAALGSDAHRALIERVVAHYRHDERVRAVAVFGSVSVGTWHELSDVDLDIVTGDDGAVAPGSEIDALFGSDAALVVTGFDCADVVLSSLEEISIRWHPLATTSPNICASVRVVYGRLTTAEIVAAGETNRAQLDERQLLDSLVRDAVGAWKALSRGHRWEAAAGVERMRRSLFALRGQRDSLRPDPADPAGALGLVIAEAAARFDLGPRRWALLERIGVPRDSDANRG